MTTDALLAEIEHFLAKPGLKMSESTFGRLAVNDGKFVGRLRNGKGLTIATMEKVRTFMRDFSSRAITTHEHAPQARAS